MPAPLAIIGAVAAVITVVGGEKVQRAIENKVGRAVAQGVLDQYGIPLDLDGEVNQFTLTQAINAGPLGGEFEFTNLFDKEAVKADVKRIAIERASEAFGYDGEGGVDAVRQKLVSDILNQISDEIEAGGGEFLAAAKDLESTAKIVMKPKPKDDWNAPRNFSKEGIANREYQAKYRASHKKHWVPR